MIAADPLWIAYKAAWYFYALGPQLVVCLLLGYLTARRRGGSLLDWLTGAFFAAMLPLVGVVIMLVLWWRADPAGRNAAGGPDAASQTVDPRP
jgi:hypothetical protein